MAVQADSLVDRVRDELQRAILSGALPPGTALRDSVIAAEMGVSRAPVREALRTLQESGLVDKLPNRSHRVAEFDETGWQDLMSLRIAYEGLAVRLAVARRADPSAIEAALRSMIVVAEGQDDVATISADWAFHDAIVHASGNGRLVEAYARLRDQIQLALLTNVQAGKGVMSGIVERHADLLGLFEDALATGDPAPLIATLEDHIATGMGVPALPGAPRPAT